MWLLCACGCVWLLCVGVGPIVGVLVWGAGVLVWLLCVGVGPGVGVFV